MPQVQTLQLQHARQRGEVGHGRASQVQAPQSDQARQWGEIGDLLANAFWQLLSTLQYRSHSGQAQGVDCPCELRDDLLMCLVQVSLELMVGCLSVHQAEDTDTGCRLPRRQSIPERQARDHRIAQAR